MRKAVIGFFLVLILISFNYAIYLKEQSKSQDKGQDSYLFLRLTRVEQTLSNDQPTLRFHYRLEDRAQVNLVANLPQSGYIIIRLEPNQTASFVGFDQHQNLLPRQRRIRFVQKEGNIEVLPNILVVAKDHMVDIQQARYAVLASNPRGHYVLVGIANYDHKIIYFHKQFNA